ncbi:uncharacterized protein LOC144119224 [Amblyomma americanum]
MGNVISAASPNESPVSSTNQLAVHAENSAGMMDEASACLSDVPKEATTGYPVKRLYPSTEPFGELADWSSPKDTESDPALPGSARETPEVSRSGPRLVSAASSVLALTRALPAPGRLSPSSDDEQRMLPPLDRHGGSRAMTDILSRQVSTELNDVSGADRTSGDPAAPRLSGLACGLLMAGALLWLVSALLALVSWRLASEPLGAELAQNVSALVRRIETLVSAGEEKEMGAQGEEFANGSVVARNMSVLVANLPTQPATVGLVLPPL